MLPEARIWLDVDDLGVISALERYVERVGRVAVLCTDGYFVSANCMRELVCAVRLGKPMIALVDPDTTKGGLSTAQ
eukprot:6283893-Prymnesium_polylepis.1